MAIVGDLKLGEIVYSAEDMLYDVVVGHTLDDVCLIYVAVGPQAVVRASIIDADHVYQSAVLPGMFRTMREAVEFEIAKMRVEAADLFERIHRAENMLRP